MVVVEDVLGGLLSTRRIKRVLTVYFYPRREAAKLKQEYETFGEIESKAF